MQANTIDSATPGDSASARLVAGWVSLACGFVCWSIWFGWRLDHLAVNPVAIGTLLIELTGLIAGAFVAVGLLRAEATWTGLPTDRRDSHRYAVAVADRMGRTRSDDLQADLLAAVERMTKLSVTGRTDRAMLGVLIDGPRRVALVAVLALALMVGVAPMPVPPMWAIAAAVAGTSLIALSNVLATAGRIRIGDRTRWSFAALGEVFSRADHAAVAPRRWVGTIGTIVVLNIAIALRGMSDRWTHGLPAMTTDHRVATMGWATVVVVGGLFTLHTMDPPELANGHLVARRLEERGARRSALGAAVCVGLIGLVAGVLPGAVDRRGGDSFQPESLVQLDAVLDRAVDD